MTSESERRQWICPEKTGRVGSIDLATLDPSDYDERRFLIKAEHPELLEAGDELVDATAHLAFHELVAQQIWDDNPPGVWATAQRLETQGYERHDIVHMLGSVVAL